MNITPSFDNFPKLHFDRERRAVDNLGASGQTNLNKRINSENENEREGTFQRDDRFGFCSATK